MITCKADYTCPQPRCSGSVCVHYVDGGNKMDWYLKITRVDNGYLLESFGNAPEGEDFIVKSVIEEDDQDELACHEKLLWEVMEYFGFRGSKHDEERLKVIREKREEVPQAPKMATLEYNESE